MGQKVNPVGFRIGVTHAWGSRWFAKKRNFGAYLLEICWLGLTSMLETS